MSVKFRKMNGLGNDFVVLDARKERIPMSSEIAERIANRETGVGCDQFIIMEPGQAPADVFMRIYNQDGREVDACGNATRCIGQLLMEETGSDKVTIETNAGLLRAYPADEGVTVDMGKPKFDWQDIPLDERMDTRGIDIKLGPIDAPVLQLPAAVNVGNPHAIFFVENIDDHDLTRFGPMVEFHPLFPEQVNVSLAQIQVGDIIKLKVWERGVGITKACGTAACAAAVSAARKNLTGRKVTVELAGGPLEIEWRENDHIYMTGPTELDYEGELDDHYFEGTPK
jgi:diaminopimelate epimerase